MIDSRHDGQSRIRAALWGIGGAGGHAAAASAGSRQVDIVVADSDARAWRGLAAPARVRFDPAATGGPDAGEAAARACLDDIALRLDGKHLCIVAAGLGGTIGSGAAPVIAAAARARGIFTVAIVTSPFAFEGLSRAAASDRAIAQLTDHADMLAVLPNQAMLSDAENGAAFRAALSGAEHVLDRAVATFIDLMPVRPAGDELTRADLAPALAAVEALLPRTPGPQRPRGAPIQPMRAPRVEPARIAACYRQGCGPEVAPARSFLKSA